MGAVKPPDGITIQFLDENGTPDGVPVHGQYVEIFGEPQQTITGGTPLPSEQGDFSGSDDWLTFVAVADTPDKMRAILADAQTAKVVSNAPQTSASSHRVVLDIRVGGLSSYLRNRTTIASGPIVNLQNVKPFVTFHVKHVKVLPEGFDLRTLQFADPNNPIVAEFKGGAIAIENLARLQKSLREDR